MSQKWIASIAIALACSPAFAGGDPVAGKEKSALCAACHGETGVSRAPNFPKLAGQNADYIVRALIDYKSGKRKNPIMGGQVANLTAEDMADLAAYFSAQEGLSVKR